MSLENSQFNYRYSKIDSKLISYYYFHRWLLIYNDYMSGKRKKQEFMINVDNAIVILMREINIAKTLNEENSEKTDWLEALEYWNIYSFNPDQFQLNRVTWDNLMKIEVLMKAYHWWETFLRKNIRNWHILTQCCSIRLCCHNH